MADEAFRSPDWREEARGDFEQRLRRARPYNRAQYLRINGLALSEVGEVQGARQLWLRVLEGTDDPGRAQHAGALESRCSQPRASSTHGTDIRPRVDGLWLQIALFVEHALADLVSTHRFVEPPGREIGSQNADLDR